MRRVMILVFSGILVLMFGVPLMVLNGFREYNPGTSANEPMVRMYNKTSGKIIIISLEEYLIGVVAAEMPANFDIEALKAQAVAARTYTVKRMFGYGSKPNPGHPDAEVCTDPTHCQAWMDTAEQKKKWGQVKYYVNADRIRTAVKMTKGQVVTYNNAFIDPVYHGSCGGKGTENSEDVWANEIPYLRGVDCSLEYRAADQSNSVQLEKRKLTYALDKSDIITPVLASGKGSLIQSIKKSSKGRIMEAVVSGKKISGTELRKILGLNSTFLVWKDEGSNITFTSIGKGHAVGMCQYGANGMAVAGKDYRAILLHYYTGVKILKLKY